MKIGGEYIPLPDRLPVVQPRAWARSTRSSGALPANIEALFPVWNDASTWNLRAARRRLRRSFYADLRSGDFTVQLAAQHLRRLAAGRLEVEHRLTLNLGVRYDWDPTAIRKAGVPAVLSGNRPHDNNNIAPRIGVNFGLDDRTVVRGGYGLFFLLARTTACSRAYSMIHRVRIPDTPTTAVPTSLQPVRPGAER